MNIHYPQTGSNWPKTLGIYLLVAAPGHLLWEIVQLPLYTIWWTDTWRVITFAIVHCTLGDLMIATLSLLTALLVLGRPNWPSESFFRVLSATILIGFGYTIFSEWLNVSVRKSWQYTDLMPVVPFIETGLSPLLQWIIVPWVTLSLTRKFTLKSV